MLRKVAQIINLFNLALSVFISLYCGKAYLFLMTTLYCAVFEILALRNKSIGMPILILTVYWEIACPFEMLLAEINPADVFSVGRNLAKAYLLDSFEIHLYYFLLSIAFYLLLMAVYYLSTRFLNRISTPSVSIVFSHEKAKLLKRGYGKKIAKLIIIVVYAWLEYYLRTTFQLNVPGKLPLISFAGVVVYLITFVHQLIAYCCLVNFSKSGRITFRGVATLTIEYLLLSIPDFLLDRRAPFIYLMLLAFLYLYILNRETVEAFIKKHVAATVSFVAAILVGFNVFSALVRYKGEYKLPLLHFVSRIVGVADGFIALEYLQKNGLSKYIHFNLIDYIVHTVHNTSESSNYVYTHEILGYPKEAVHGSSMPLFVGSLMYSGFVGFVVICVIFAIILSFAQYMMEKSEKRNQKKIYAYIGSYISVYGVSLIMGGGAERMIELFTIPVMLLIYSLFERFTHREERVGGMDQGACF